MSITRMPNPLSTTVICYNIRDMVTIELVLVVTKYLHEYRENRLFFFTSIHTHCNVFNDDLREGSDTYDEMSITRMSIPLLRSCYIRSMYPVSSVTGHIIHNELI